MHSALYSNNLNSSWHLFADLQTLSNHKPEAAPEADHCIMFGNSPAQTDAYAQHLADFGGVQQKFADSG
jgi:hypothetical protein